MPNRSSTEDNIERLTNTVEDFCGWIESLPAKETRTQEWGPREILAHLVYWHEQYITQSKAILSGRQFPTPSGRFAEMNSKAAAKFQNFSIAKLTGRFRNANRRLCRLAREHDPRKIAFSIKQGSKRWRLSDLIPAVEAHVRNHLRALKKAFEDA
ncbi:MAG TPA: ClbS/DfsB family four-helix bundle protein [Anaerolineales bacterium]